MARLKLDELNKQQLQHLQETTACLTVDYHLYSSLHVKSIPCFQCKRLYCQKSGIAIQCFDSLKPFNFWSIHFTETSLKENNHYSKSATHPISSVWPYRKSAVLKRRLQKFWSSKKSAKNISRKADQCPPILLIY